MTTTTQDEDMAHVTLTNFSSYTLFVDLTKLSLASPIFTNKTSFVWTFLQWKTFLPVDVASLLSLVVLLAGILCNSFLGLYVGEKFIKPCGIRTLLCNQILANLMALFSYTFVPLRMLDKEPLWDHERLCKVMPSIGFLAASVSLTNMASICVSYYSGKKTGKFALASRRVSTLLITVSWLLAIAITAPMTKSLTTLEVEINRTRAAICAAVWLDENYRDVYMNWVFIFKFALPLLIMFSTGIKTELLRLKSKRMKHCREVSLFVIDVLAVIGFWFLIYLFPLTSMGVGKLSWPASTAHTLNIVRILELIVLANCAIVPMLLTAFVDEYHQTKIVADCLRVTMCDAKDKPLDTRHLLGNASYVTYDVLIDDMPEKWRPTPFGVLVV